MGKQEFFEACREAKRIAYSFKNPLIIHHYDADGISAAAITYKALSEKGIKARRKWVKSIDEEVIENLEKEKEIIFLDLGSSTPRINELKDVLIIDHHQPEKIEKPEVNPLNFGIDGGVEISAAGVAYCVFEKMPEMAVVGAVGDMQYPLKGINREIVKRGEKEGRIRVEKDLCFYGRHTRTLLYYLCYAQPPIPNISWNENRVREFLKALGIDEKKRYAELTHKQKTKLFSEVFTIFLENGVKPRLLCEHYVFPRNPKDERYEAHEFSTLLNACGRHGYANIGVEVCIGNKIEEAKKLLTYHRREIKNAVKKAQRIMQDLGPYYFIDGRGTISDGIIGIVCGIMLKDKPVIGIAKKEGKVKISMRGKDVNVGKIIKEVIKKVGGEGGGHHNAGGANIEKEKLNDFLIECGKHIMKEVKGLSGSQKEQDLKHG